MLARAYSGSPAGLWQFPANGMAERAAGSSLSSSAAQLRNSATITSHFVEDDPCCSVAQLTGQCAELDTQRWQKLFFSSREFSLKDRVRSDLGGSSCLTRRLLSLRF